MLHFAHSRKADLKQPSPDSENWTADEVAAFLRVSPRKLSYLRAMGALPKSTKVGRTVVFKASEIRAWFDAGCPVLDEWEAIKERQNLKF